MKFILGKKLAMTQVFKDDGTVVPVTRVLVDSCQITQVKTGKNNAVQVGFGSCRDKVLSKSEKGHLKNLDPVKYLKDFAVNKDQTQQVKRGDYISLETFIVGDKVSITGISKGKGFQGVVKRHGFHGGPASHGHKDQLRMPGSIGATGPQKVFKGTKMGGRMGGDQITIKNLEVVQIDLKNKELYIKGAVPGSRNGFLAIKAEGELKLVDNIKPVAKEVNMDQKEEIGTKKTETKEMSVSEKVSETKKEEK